jgi:hypothetical protein
MSENLKRLNPDFFIADADCPVIMLFDSNCVRVKFLDFRESQVEIEFYEVIGFKWNMEDHEYPTISDDSVYEVQNSIWLDKYIETDLSIKNENYKHYKLCFNGYEILDILFSNWKIIQSPSFKK